MPGLPNTFQYGPAVFPVRIPDPVKRLVSALLRSEGKTTCLGQYLTAFFAQVAPTSSKQHGVNVGVNASATPFQQASGYGSHGYSTGEAISYLRGMFGGGRAGPAHSN